LSGHYPKAVEDTMVEAATRSLAARNFALGGTGIASSPFGAYNVAKHLGRDIPLRAFETGLNTFNNWVQLAGLRAAKPFDFSPMFLTTSDVYNADVNRANVKAAPDPGLRGLHDTFMQVMGMALGAIGGGAGYTGTYRPQQMQPFGSTYPSYGAEAYPSSGWYAGSPESPDAGTGEAYSGGGGGGKLGGLFGGLF
jgi:hypothetical protein